VRELGGRVHLFAHNGGFGGIETWFARSVHRFHPVGDTDSEKGFCLLLDRLLKIWEGAMPPPLDVRLAVVEAFAAEMRPLGIANFLYSDGEFVFGHGHRRTQADGVVAPPGLWVRHRRRRGAHAAAIAPPAASGVTIHQDEQAAHDVQEIARQRAGDGRPLVAAGPRRDRRRVGWSAGRRSGMTRLGMPKWRVRAPSTRD
jgi:hypothetical protein